MTAFGLEFGTGDLVFLGSLLGVGLALGMLVITTTFYRQRERLPAATQYEDVREQLAVKQLQLAEKRQELAELDRRATERDHLIAEVAGLETRLDHLRTEYNALSDSRREIDDMIRQATDAAAQYAGEKQKLDLVLAELGKASSALAEAADQQRRADEAAARALEARDMAEQARAAAEADLIRLHPELETAQRIIADARDAESRVAVASELLKVLEARRADLDSDLGPLRQETDRLNADSAAARTAHAEAEAGLRRLELGVHQAESQATALAEKVKSLEAERKGLDTLLGLLHREAEEFRTEATVARSARVDAEADLRHLEAQKATLEHELDRLKQFAARAPGTGAPVEQNPAVILADLFKQPDCLQAPAVLRRVPRSEAEALDSVASHVREHGLTYHERTLKGFHTSLKINDVAQITVLAGVSGTGKSLLPRRYAEAMGIHFLQIAVEPRWDSPQDLLGFYNYVESRFRATDLSRLLGRMDPSDTAGLRMLTSQQGQGANRQEHMALVLLDEMNLARVEYYFSEFLSRLEARDPYQPGAEPRPDARIPIDIRGLKRDLRLFPSHNVLFAGTMNDDESTMALSPKVLDRGNVLQFAEPAQLKGNAAPAKSPAPSAEAQHFDEWRSWVRPFAALAQSQRDTVDSAVHDIAALMEKFGRPIGYRTRDAIRAYCANYPATQQGRTDMRIPLADQIEFRVLPRLRGTEIEPHMPTMEALVRFVRKDQDDGQLADRVEKIVESQSKGSGLFNWRGLTRR
ncbi:hypothetical protein [Zavarzinia sp. CC-PAN008]|uniref:hypothetical protein n=1 Tax=Zavarzinia sp. CC-PAN008 TaxID=3243332 RepID=UPI003F745039